VDNDLSGLNHTHRHTHTHTHVRPVQVQSGFNNIWPAQSPRRHDILHTITQLVPVNWNSVSKIIHDHMSGLSKHNGPIETLLLLCIK